MINTSERLFASQGVDAVSVRAINAAAGQGPASVHYRPVRDRIAANLDVLAANAQPPTPAEVVHALTDPYLELLLQHRVRGMRWVKIVVQIAGEGRPALTAAGQDALSVSLRTQAQRAFPRADPDRIALRWPIAVMSFLQVLSRADELAAPGSQLSVKELIASYEDVVSYAIGGAERMLG